MAELNGAPVTPNDLQVLALVNYGHFTSMRVDDQHIRGLSHHLDRLVRDCRVLFGAELDRERVREFIRHAVTDKSGSFVVRVTIFDPALDLGRPGIQAEPKVLVTTRPAGAWPMSPLRVQAINYRRDMPPVKHIGLFGALWCRRTAQLNGFDDVLFTDTGSFICEGATWNVGFFDGERVIWPHADTLPGVTMRLLQQVHEPTSVLPINLADVPKMQAAFATNTTVGVRAISTIDNMQLPEAHPIFDSLRKEFLEIPAETL